jgi:SAM-dependent methyltransferase
MSAQPRQCPLCAHRAPQFDIVGEHVFGGRREQHFYACPACTVAFIHPPMSVDEEREFYAREFEKFMQSRAGNDGGWQGPEAHIAANQGTVARRLRVLRPLLPPAGSRVLEFGCSSGFMLLALRELGLQVMGMEPSGGFVDFVRSCGIPVAGSEAELAGLAPPGSLDLILHFFVFEHMRDPLEFLRRSVQLLKPGGQIFFEVPSASDPLLTIYNVPAFQMFYWSAAHHWYFNRASLAYLLDRLGLRYTLIPEQRYDLSNHMWWALAGKPGGAGRFAGQFTPELEAAYLESMRRTGHCDTYFVQIVNQPAA